MDMLQIFRNISENHYSFKDLVFEYQDYYIATDTYFMLVVPKNYVSGEFTISKKSPDMSFILNSKRHDPIKIDMEFLKQKFQEAPKIDTYDDCKKCEGYGTISCACCKNDVKCKVCGGSGLDKSSPKKANDFEYVFTFGEQFLTIHLIDLLIRTIESLEYEGDVNIISSELNQPMIIEIGDKFIAMAPRISADTSKVIKIY